jgi:hypothetical protein
MTVIRYDADFNIAVDVLAFDRRVAERGSL